MTPPAVLEARDLMAWPADDAILLVLTDGAAYNDAVVQVTSTLSRRFRQGVYVTANRPHHALRSNLALAGVDAESLVFIDCVSSLTGIVPPQEPNVVHVESPTMLEKASMRADQQLRRMDGRARFLVIDSLSSFSLYNGEGPVTELAHSLVNRLRLQGVPAALLMVERQSNREFIDLVGQLCDGIVRL